MIVLWYVAVQKFVGISEVLTAYVIRAMIKAATCLLPGYTVQQPKKKKTDLFIQNTVCIQSATTAWRVLCTHFLSVHHLLSCHTSLVAEEAQTQSNLDNSNCVHWLGSVCETHTHDDARSPEDETASQGHPQSGVEQLCTPQQQALWKKQLCLQTGQPPAASGTALHGARWGQGRLAGSKACTAAAIVIVQCKAQVACPGTKPSPTCFKIRPVTFWYEAKPLQSSSSSIHVSVHEAHYKAVSGK
jgi:hypothetical protein